MTYRGHVHNGIIVLDEPAELKEGAALEIVFSVAPDARPVEPDTLYNRLKPFIGMADGLPSDGSINIDHYLYGTPKI